MFLALVFALTYHKYNYHCLFCQDLQKTLYHFIYKLKHKLLIVQHDTELPLSDIYLIVKGAVAVRKAAAQKIWKKVTAARRRIFQVRKLFSTIITGKYGKVVIVRETYSNNA